MENNATLVHIIQLFNPMYFNSLLY